MSRRFKKSGQNCKKISKHNADKQAAIRQTIECVRMSVNMVVKGRRVQGRSSPPPCSGNFTFHFIKYFHHIFI